ncbi:OmpA family protein [Mucilaginibacter sp.]|uniref:OmpA family protein n=1 Tax=Mucilaginibacter sp. TaxID=1882438 RepID=UPI0025E7BF2E|nr:OmpA family protein [Mucilaginibacter sp.]
MKTKIALSIAFLLIPCFTINAYSSPAKNSGKKKYRVIHSTSYKLKFKRSVSMSIEEITKNLEFDFSRADVHTQYTEQLDQLAKLMNEGKYALALRGHADSIGTYVGNWKLSDKRALAVKKYLVEKGVPEDKIVTTPFGSTLPVSSNKTSAGRKKNRRVEIKLQSSNS